MKVARGVILIVVGTLTGWFIHPAAPPATPTVVFHETHKPDRAEALIRWWLYNDARWNLSEIEAAEADTR
jgi:hypothetical protein